jgi:hypothetical protein
MDDMVDYSGIRTWIIDNLVDDLLNHGHNERTLQDVSGRLSDDPCGRSAYNDYTECHDDHIGFTNAQWDHAPQSLAS